MIDDDILDLLDLARATLARLDSTSRDALPERTTGGDLCGPRYHLVAARGELGALVRQLSEHATQEEAPETRAKRKGTT